MQRICLGLLPFAILQNSNQFNFLPESEKLELIESYRKRITILSLADVASGFRGMALVALHIHRVSGRLGGPLQRSGSIEYLFVGSECKYPRVVVINHCNDLILDQREATSKMVAGDLPFQSMVVVSPGMSLSPPQVPARLPSGRVIKFSAPGRARPVLMTLL